MSNGDWIYEHAIKQVVVGLIPLQLHPERFWKKGNLVKIKRNILNDIFQVIYVLKMIYQVGKKQCSNSGRKRNDIDSLESDFIVQPPSPLEFPGPLTPPPPWNFQFPPWWGSGYFLEPAHIVWKYIFYCTYSIKTKMLSMLGTEYFLKIREILVVTSAFAVRPYSL